MTDWNDSLALKPNDSAVLIPVRVSGLDLDGKGKGEIGVYLYTKRFLPPNQASLFGPDDIGQDHEYVDELTGKCRYGQIVNVPMDLLPDHIDPKTGKMRMVTELEARRREQAAKGTPVSVDPIVSVIVTTVRKSGAKDVVGSLGV